MKKTLLLLMLLFAAKSIAQSPIIKEFRQVVAARDSQFKNLQKELVREDATNGIQIFSSTIPDSVISRAVVVTTKTEGTTYIISYDVESMDEMKLKIFINMVNQYIEELNDMAASGKYTAKDFKDGDDNVTELTDSNGKRAVQYLSNNKQHMILVFGI